MQKSEEVMSHLKDHQKYPATKEELGAACGNLSDFSEEDKKEFAEKLPDGSYNSAEDVINALEL